MKNGMLTRKRARRLRELMRDTKSAPVAGSAQSRSRARIIGTGNAQAARIVLSYHDACAALRSEVTRLRIAMDTAAHKASVTAMRGVLLRTLTREDGAG